MRHQTDVLIIGAGPAGLAVAAGCRAHGRDFLAIEAGPPVERRDHSDQRALGVGVGGSGLFSDGKFSFYPSATALWALPDRAALEAAWRWFAEALGPFGLPVPDLPVAGAPPGPAHPTRDDSIWRKDYDSIYLPLEHRRRLIEQLQAECGGQLLTGAELHAVRHDERAGLLRCEIRLAGMSSLDQVVARAAVYAGGRFGPITWPSVFAQAAQVFRRVEVGVRLEQNSDDFFLSDDPRRDPKFILQSPDGRYSWLTFCCCRGGEVVTTEVQGVCSVSGRADGPPSGRSNVGFNLRVTDASFAKSLWPNGLRQTAGERRTASQPLVEFLDHPDSGGIAEVLGGDVARLLAEGLRALGAAHPRLLQTPCLVTAPAIEGVGCYPELTETLRHGDMPLWVAGDATGVFRGLTAALVSGYFAASRAAGYLEESSLKNLTKPLPVVFTAQSKQYFYCRDAICVFVLNQGRVPLNPFRAFDYFLGERTDRDLVRQANFNLVRIADELWVFGDTIANGVLAEIKYAIQQGKPIRFFTISAHAHEIRPLSLDELEYLRSETELSEEIGIAEFRNSIGTIQQWLLTSGGRQ